MSGDKIHAFASRDVSYVLGLRLWWRHAVIEGVDHRGVMAKIAEDGGWSPRYAFMVLMSAGIAALGLLMSSPAIVIGAMLISPLMNPILFFGFSLATFDFAETRRALATLAIGSALAVAFAWLIVVLSPLKEVTAEILSRTRPNLFDFLVAMFAALAGAYAIIKGGGGTIVGVAIAIALMPPLAVVGYGLATWNLPVLGGALELFVTNFVTIALAAAIVARLYGFGYSLSGPQGWMQVILLTLVFACLALPLGLSLSRIAREAVIVTETRSFLSDEFGASTRVNHLAINFDTEPLSIHAVMITPRSESKDADAPRKALEKKLGRQVEFQVDQLLLAPNAYSPEAQRAQLQAASSAAAAAKASGDRVARALALVAGVTPDDVTLDRDHKRAMATAVALPGGDIETYRALERRASAASPDWRIIIIPPLGPLPLIRFANGSDVLDNASQRAVLTSAWAAQRWNNRSLGVPGLPSPEAETPTHPLLRERRALAIGAILRAQGVQAVPAPAAGRAFRLTLASITATP